MFHCIYKLFSSISYFEMKQEGHVDNTMTKEHYWNYNTKVFKNLYQNLCPPPHHLYCWSLLPILQIQEQLSQNLQDLFEQKSATKSYYRIGGHHHQIIPWPFLHDVSFLRCPHLKYVKPDLHATTLHTVWQILHSQIDQCR